MLGKVFILHGIHSQQLLRGRGRHSGSDMEERLEGIRLRHRDHVGTSRRECPVSGGNMDTAHWTGLGWLYGFRSLWVCKLKPLT